MNASIRHFFLPAPSPPLHGGELSNMKRSLLLLFVFLISMNLQAQQAPPRPNVLLIMCDDLGWGDTGFNGNEVVKTPHLDALAGKGVVLNRFYAASPVCSPTRASCITGRHPERMGIHTANSGHLPPEEITLPELLRTAGYATGHFGKWHLGTLTAMVEDANRGQPRDYQHYSLPTANGYDTYFCTESKVPTWDPMFKPAVFDTTKGESLHYGWAAREEGEPVETYGTFYWSGPEELVLDNLQGDNSRIIMDRVIPFVQQSVQAQKPFFSTVWFHTPHLPVSTSAHYRSLYPDLPYSQQLYYGTITAMDEQVGRLWTELERLGVADNTMLWFCSDNGPENRTPGSSGPYRERKRSLYEGGVRVPAFCVWPDQLAGGSQTEAPIFTSDYLPTILQYLEINYPDDRPLDGVDVRALLTGERTIRNAPMGFWFNNRRSWLTDRYKLISTDAGKSYELYDLQLDAAEKHNIAAENPLLVEQMKVSLLTWWLSVSNSEQGGDY
jgi:arylsulfatase A-like enzyme